ncbi:hypothetical protein E2C01_011061 [Portunus trituberculatus]|uniref:Uncharacterized protein n=1 Tax=Portunus trituberculatus TaxID=210409 RepID=A0A5B7DA12_PORTR|nr:hypothetical protein [Portunus trituberculatus]
MARRVGLAIHKGLHRLQLWYTTMFMVVSAPRGSSKHPSNEASKRNDGFCSTRAIKASMAVSLPLRLQAVPVIQKDPTSCFAMHILSRY